MKQSDSKAKTFAQHFTINRATTYSFNVPSPAVYATLAREIVETACSALIVDCTDIAEDGLSTTIYWLRAAPEKR